MYEFYKNFIFLSKNFFFSNKVIYLKNIFVSPFKKFNPVKKNSLCEKINSVEQTHSVKDDFYFQFSFATNEQV